jgi:hypothetical protein
MDWKSCHNSCVTWTACTLWTQLLTSWGSSYYCPFFLQLLKGMKFATNFQLLIILAFITADGSASIVQYLSASCFYKYPPAFRILILMCLMIQNIAKCYTVGFQYIVVTSLAISVMIFLTTMYKHSTSFQFPRCLNTCIKVLLTASFCHTILHLTVLFRTSVIQ